MDEISTLPPVAPQTIPQVPAPTTAPAVQSAPVSAAQPPVLSAPLPQPPQPQIEETINISAEETTEEPEDQVEVNADEPEEEPESLSAAQDEKVESGLTESFEEQPSEAGQ